MQAMGSFGHFSTFADRLANELNDSHPDLAKLMRPRPDDEPVPLNVDAPVASMWASHDAADRAETDATLVKSVAQTLLDGDVLEVSLGAGKDRRFRLPTINGFHFNFSPFPNGFDASEIISITVGFAERKFDLVVVDVDSNMEITMDVKSSLATAIKRWVVLAYRAGHLDDSLLDSSKMIGRDVAALEEKLGSLWESDTQTVDRLLRQLEMSPGKRVIPCQLRMSDTGRKVVVKNVGFKNLAKTPTMAVKDTAAREVLKRAAEGKAVEAWITTTKPEKLCVWTRSGELESFYLDSHVDVTAEFLDFSLCLDRLWNSKNLDLNLGFARRQRHGAYITNKDNLFARRDQMESVSPTSTPVLSPERPLSPTLPDSDCWAECVQEMWETGKVPKRLHPYIEASRANPKKKPFVFVG
ncbi:hypothetical protein OIO90_003980 [Microbotryomycetes sp. JL221]|nr:hypothetical protein OIO90_003980 [Microbotryomycetes sp. JL221]